MADPTPRQIEILQHLAHLTDGEAVYVRPSGNTDCANLHTYTVDEAVIAPAGTTYSRVLYPLRDAGLLTISEELKPRGRRVLITERGLQVLTARSSRGLAGIRARLQLVGDVSQLATLLTDVRRMSRALGNLAMALDDVEHRGEASITISRVRYLLREVLRDS